MAAAAELAPEGAAGGAGLITYGVGFVSLALAIAWNYTVGAGLRSIAAEIEKVRLPRIAGGGRVFGVVADQFYAVDREVHGALVAVANANLHAGRWLFNETARAWDWTVHSLAHLAVATDHALEHFDHVTLPRWARHALSHTGAFASWILAEGVRLERRQHDFTRRLVHGQAAKADTEFGLARRGIDVTRHEAATLEREVVQLRARVKSLEKAIAHTATPVFFWEGLSRIGLRWFRCPAFVRTGRKLGCLGFSLLEDLLAASFIGLVTTDICRIMGAVTALAEWYKPLLMDLVDVEDQLIGCHGATKPDPLKLPRLYLPPVPDPLPLG